MVKRICAALVASSAIAGMAIGGSDAASDIEVLAPGLGECIIVETETASVPVQIRFNIAIKQAKVYLNGCRRTDGLTFTSKGVIGTFDRFDGLNIGDKDCDSYHNPNILIVKGRKWTDRNDRQLAFRFFYVTDPTP